MTDAIGIIALSEGLPETARPSLLLPACAVRRDRRRWEDIALAVVIANMVLGGFSDRPQDPLDRIRGMFTDEEFEQIKAQQEEAEMMALEMQQMEKLRRFMEHGRHTEN